MCSIPLYNALRNTLLSDRHCGSESRSTYTHVGFHVQGPLKLSNLNRHRKGLTIFREKISNATFHKNPSLHLHSQVERFYQELCSDEKLSKNRVHKRSESVKKIFRKRTSSQTYTERSLLIHSVIPLACAECDESLPFSGASSIPLCYVLLPATLLHQLFFHPPSLHRTIYCLVYLSILLFPNSYIMLFWESYFLPFSAHAQTNAIYLTLLSLLQFFF